MCTFGPCLLFVSNWNLYFDSYLALNMLSWRLCLISEGYTYKISLVVNFFLKNMSHVRTFKHIDWECWVVPKYKRRCWKISRIWNLCRHLKRFEQTHNASGSDGLKVRKLFFSPLLAVVGMFETFTCGSILQFCIPSFRQVQIKAWSLIL